MKQLRQLRSCRTTEFDVSKRMNTDREGNFFKGMLRHLFCFFIFVLCIFNVYNPKGLKSTPGITDIQDLPISPKDEIQILRDNNNNKETNGSDSIPHRLIFTYGHNILTHREPDHFYRNVANTIQIYRKAWESTVNNSDHQIGGDAAANVFHKNIDVAGVVHNFSAYDASNRNDGSVLFFDDHDCLEMIRKVEPRLALPFELETTGSFKADICRLAALYAYGGYYFDVDLEAIRPLPQRVMSFNNSRVSFVSSWTLPLKNEFFQAILAVSSNHPVIRANMDVMIEEWYYNYNVADRVFLNAGFYDPIKARKLDLNNRSEAIQLFQHVWDSKLYTSAIKKDINNKIGGCTQHCELGTSTLAIAYKRLKKNSSLNWTDFLLEEINDAVVKRYPELKRIEKGWGCPWLVHDPLTSTPYFYSRTRGTRGCPKTNTSSHSTHKPR
jgi:hypothetical protein